jgi:hypothetical protein
MSKLSLQPHKGKPLFRATEAWWYENEHSIEVYITSDDGGRIFGAKLTRRQLQDWLRRTESLLAKTIGRNDYRPYGGSVLATR